MCRDGMSDDTSRANYTAFSYGNARKDCHVRAYPAVVSDVYWQGIAKSAGFSVGAFQFKSFLGKHRVYGRKDRYVRSEVAVLAYHNLSVVLAGS